MAGDTGLLREMAVMTVPEFAPLVQQSSDCIAEEDLTGAVRALHKLKGMLSTFESDGVVLEIQEVIHAGRSGRCDLAASLWEHHRPAIDNLIDEIGTFAGR